MPPWRIPYPHAHGQRILEIREHPPTPHSGAPADQWWTIPVQITLALGSRHSTLILHPHPSPDPCPCPASRFSYKTSFQTKPVNTRITLYPYTEGT